MFDGQRHTWTRNGDISRPFFVFSFQPLRELVALLAILVTVAGRHCECMERLVTARFSSFGYVQKWNNYFCLNKPKNRKTHVIATPSSLFTLRLPITRRSDTNNWIVTTRRKNFQDPSDNRSREKCPSVRQTANRAIFFFRGPNFEFRFSFAHFCHWKKKWPTFEKSLSRTQKSRYFNQYWLSFIKFFYLSLS